MNEQVEQPEISDVEVVSSQTELLSLAERDRLNQLRADIERAWDAIPIALQGSPETQKKCLDHLLSAEEILANDPLSRIDLIRSQVFGARHKRGHFKWME